MSNGDLRRVVEVAVIGGALQQDGSIAGGDAIYPCGRCRQMIYEAASLGGRDIIVHCSSADGAVVTSHRMSELLPHAFGPGDLGIS